MTFGTEWGWGADETESRNIFDAYVERGGNFLDTANRYTEGTSERWLGKFVHDDRERFVIATKYTMRTRKGEPNAAGNHRKSMRESLDASLKRLGLDYIDLYWVHAWDFLTPVDEVMRALDDAVAAGKILYVGVSDTPAWIVSQANTMAALRGWTPFVGLQIEYSLVQRTVERDLIPMAQALGLAVLAWAPLGAGVLSGKYHDKSAKTSTGEKGRITPGGPRLTDRNLAIASELSRVAQEIGRPPSQVAINWLRQRSGTVIPILGARKAAQITENLGALDFELAPEHLARLDEISKIELGFPHDWLAQPNIQDLVFAGLRGSIKP
jgi:aryl-alcohol dehydrogenase-like predicted oxidoreductase